MNCICGNPSLVSKSIDAGDAIIRNRRCPACGATWVTEESLRKGSFRNPPEVHAKPAMMSSRPGLATNGHGRPPPAMVAPPVASVVAEGVGGGLPSGIDPSGIQPDPSRQSSQDLPRAREFWNCYDWRRKYGVLWCAKYGGTAIGGDGESDEKLGVMLDELPVSDRMAAQARAQEMFREFLAEGGEPAKARHRWAFFVGRFPALRVPMTKPTEAQGYREFA